MKKILLIICLFPILVFSQKSYKIPADSTILNNIGSGKNELVIRNATSNITGGVLTNLGNGVTAFVLGGGSARVVDTIYKNNTKDSIVFTISGIRYAVKDSFNLNTDSQTLSISNDTLTISGGNSVILPVYIQIDSSTINSYDVLNSQNTPPISPNTGDVYLVGTVPTGAWVGQAKDIAEWNGSGWVFTDGVQGDFLYNATTALTYIFRSGNWVQTTGIPALNNGNTISSGLRIGTNNARSLTFETNNTNRGRFDSIGRFHVYNLPTSADTFVSVTDVNGKFGKVGKSSFLSGVNGSSALLPNGVKYLTESRDLQADDAGYILFLLSETEPVVLTIPEISPLQVGDNFEIILDESGDWQNSGFIWSGVLLKPEINESVFFTTTTFEGNPYSLAISTLFTEGKTAFKYLYDKSQDAIPLSGTEVGKPVTGDIELYNTGDDATGYLKYNASDGLFMLGNDETYVSGASLHSKVSSANDYISVNSDKVLIGTLNSGYKGIGGINDFSANITDLDYTQKIYVDQRISDTATQIRSEIADTASSLHTLIDTKVSATGTATLTNKRITARVDSTASSATPTINTDNVDTYKLTAQAADITSFTTNLSGTPTDDQILHIVIIGTATRAITWGSKFEASTVALPTTTVGTDRLDVYFIWNTFTSKWRCGGVW